MAKIQLGYSFGSKLCEKLGLTTEKVREITISIKPDSFVTINVDMYAEDKSLDYFLTDYDFKPINTTEKEVIQND